MWKSLLSTRETRLFHSLDTPTKIQDFLNTIPINIGRGSGTLRSPRETLRANKAHCIEGALFAAAVLWHQGEKPIILDLRSAKEDTDHVVALFRRGKYWGAISKTNHAVLRYRDPIYRSVRELAMSYFHEYFLNGSGKKTLIDFSEPFSLLHYGTEWVISKKHLWDIAEDLDASPHTPFAPKKMILRPADRIERNAGKLVEWKGGKRMI